MSCSRSLVLRLYAAALFFYPPVFRKRYASEMLEAARLEAAQSRSTLRLAASLFWDTLRSFPIERWHETEPSSPITFILIVACFTAVFAYSTISTQRTWRQVADYAPTTMTLQYVQATTAPTCATYPSGCTMFYAKLLSASHQQEISSPTWLNSGPGFINFYDNAGQALGGNGTLHGKWAQPPASMFETIRRQGETHVIWQPQRGIRIALAGRPLPSGGFIVSGSSLAPGDAQIARFTRTLLPLWLFLFAICLPWKMARRNTRERRAAEQ